MYQFKHGKSVLTCKKRDKTLNILKGRCSLLKTMGAMKKLGGESFKIGSNLIAFVVKFVKK